MRMWLVDPKIMCRKHLLGEHVELHMFVGTINNRISIKGYIANNLLEMQSIQSRHEELVNEMKRRGMNHNSPLPCIIYNPVVEEHGVNRESSLAELLRRCEECRERFKSVQI